MKLGELLRVARQMRGLSLRALEEQTGISNPSLSNIETGRSSNPGWWTVVRIAQHLKIPYETLLGCDRPEEEEHQDKSG